MTDVNSKRIVWIDYAKALAIFLVVLFHVHCGPIMTVYINAFIIPMFFIISGYLFSYQRNPSHKRFVIKRSRQLLFPYLWIGLVAWVAWVVVLRHYGEDAGIERPWYLPLMGLFSGISTLLIQDIPLWSLLSFYVVEMAFYPTGRTITATILVAVMAFVLSAIITAIVPQGTLSQVPLVLGPSLTGLGFYALGHLWQLFSGNAKLNRVLFSWPVLVIAAILFIFSASSNGIVEFYICKFNNYGLFLISSISGSIVAISLMNVLAKAIGSNKFVRFVSNGTLIICGFHLLVFALIKGIAILGFGLEPYEIMSGYIKGIAFAVVAFCGTLPIVWFIRKYLRFLVDK